LLLKIIQEFNTLVFNKIYSTKIAYSRFLFYIDFDFFFVFEII
jgi:hypothetical protein